MSKNDRNGEGLPGSLAAFMLSHLKMPKECGSSEYNTDTKTPLDISLVADLLDDQASTPRPPDIHPTRPPDTDPDPIVNAVKALVNAGMPKDLIADAVSLIGGKKPQRPPDIHPTSTRHDQIEARRRWDREYRKRKRAEAKTSTPRPPDSIQRDLSSLTSLPLKKNTNKDKRDSGIRARALADDWAPNPKHLELAQDLGHSQQDVTTFAADMRDWAAANAGRAVSKKTNWDAAFNNWIRRQRRPTNARPGPGISNSQPRKENGSQRAYRLKQEAIARQSGTGLSGAGEPVVDLDSSEWTTSDHTGVNGRGTGDL